MNEGEYLRQVRQTELAKVPSAPAELKKPKIEDQQTLRALVQSDWFRQSVAAVAAKHFTPEGVVKMALLAVSRQQGLLECTPESFLKAVLDAGEVGLDFSGSNGEGYLVPYKNKRTGKPEASFIPGYQGLEKLAYQSGEVLAIDCHVVHENDVFEFELGLEPRLRHIPAMKPGQERGAVIGVYAIAHLKGGHPRIEWMSVQEIDAIAKRAPAYGGGPWQTDTNEMRRKTVERRLCKRLPKSRELTRALELESQADELAGLSVALPRTMLSTLNGNQTADERLENYAERVLNGDESGSDVKTKKVKTKNDKETDANGDGKSV